MTVPDHIQKAIQAYYAERITDEQLAALEDWFREDEANLRQFAEHGLVEWHMLCEHEKQDAAAILTMLREAEEKAEPDYSLLDTPLSLSPAGPVVTNTGSFGELFTMAGYFTVKAIRSKAGTLAALAAVLVIGLVLYIGLAGQSDAPEAPETANNPTNDDPEDTAAQSPIVATLTAGHDAVWAQGPATLTAGASLSSGQRLTLTQGFAEITTARGAIAILEAPASVELTDNDNAIRLHTGKLFGICETESSKGFVVHTSQASITDLGTRFGVAVDRAENLFAEVFAGSIAVSPVADRSSPSNTEILQAGASIALDGQAQPIAYANSAAPSFDGLALPAIGVVRVAGQVAVLHSMPDSLRPDDLAPNDNAYLIQEPVEPALKDNLELSIALPGEYVDFIDQSSTTTLPAGAAVRSYALIIRPEPDAENSVFQGSITFDSEIVGVLADVKSWQRFDNATDGLSMKAPPGVKQLLEGVSLGIDPGSTDRIKLHDDRRTLSFYANTNQHFDAIRVLVKPKPTAE